MQISDINILQIEPTTYCNARCPHCARFDRQGNLHPDLKLGHLNLDVLKSSLELEKMTGLNTVLLEGDKGDPLMHPNIEEIIDFFCSSSIAPNVDVYTNGSIRSPQWWRRLAEKKYANLNVIFSIDGLEDVNHLYRVGLDYHDIMQNAQAYINAGGVATWKFITFKHNEHQLQQVLEKSRDMGFAEFSYQPCRPGDFRGQSKWPVMADNQVTHYLERPDFLERGHIVHKAIRPVRNAKSEHPERICPYLQRGQIYITYTGHVLPCCIMHFDVTLDYPGTKKLREMTEGFDNQDLSRYTMSEILQNPFFKHRLHDSFVQNKLHFNCGRTCKQQIQHNMDLLKVD